MIAIFLYFSLTLRSPVTIKLLQFLDGAASDFNGLVLDRTENDFEDCVGTLGAIEDWTIEPLFDLKHRAITVR